MAQEKDRKEGMAFLGEIALFVVLIIYASFAWGFVFLKLYNWYVLPVFTQLPAIHLLQSVGLVLVTRMFKGTKVTMVGKDGEQIKPKKDYGFVIVGPWVFLLVAWMMSFLIK